MNRDEVRRTFIGGAGLFFMFWAIVAGFGALESQRNHHPRDAVWGLLVAVLFGSVGASLLWVRRERDDATGEAAQEPHTQPIVRKEWLVAMAIVAVSLIPIALFTCSAQGAP